MKAKKMCAALLFASVMLSACVSSSPGALETTETNEAQMNETEVQQGEETTEKEPVTISVSWWGTDSRHTAMQAAIDKFMEKYDWITVESSFSGWEGYHDKLTVQLSSGDAPDLFAFGRGYSQQYGAGDTLIDLSEYRDDIPYYAEIEESIKNPYQTVDGKVTGLATGISATVVIYDKKHFDAARVEYPTDEETWVSLGEKWSKVHAALPDIYGEKGWMYVGEIFPLMMKQLGQEMFDASTEPATVRIDPQAADKIWSWNETLWDEGTIARDSSDTIDFKAGNLGSYLAASSAIPNIKNDTEDPMGYAVIPKTFDGTGKKIGYPAAPGGLWGIPSTSKHIEEALLLLSFLQTDLEAVKIIGIEFGAPSVPSALKILQDGAYEKGSLEYEMLDIVDRSAEGNDETWSIPMPVGYTQAQEAYQVELERYIYGETDKETFIENAQQVMNDAFAANQ